MDPQRVQRDANRCSMGKEFCGPVNLGYAVINTVKDFFRVKYLDFKMPMY